MKLHRQLQTIGLLALAHVVALNPAVAQSEKQAPPPMKPAQPTSAGTNANLPACNKFQDWRYGQECRRNDGKTCQVMGQRADPGELKFCK
jgi:hypothetical protein